MTDKFPVNATEQQLRKMIGSIPRLSDDLLKIVKLELYERYEPFIYQINKFKSMRIRRRLLSDLVDRLSHDVAGVTFVNLAPESFIRDFLTNAILAAGDWDIDSEGDDDSI